MDSNSTEPGQYLPIGSLGTPAYPQSSPWPLLQSMANTNTSFLQAILNFSAVYVVNTSDGGLESKFDPLGGHSLWQVILIVLFTGLLSLITIIGNILVIVSFKVNRQLKTVNNYFLLSLAFADLIIGVISMNLYTAYIVMGQWAMGNWACDFWLAIDYVASNASVMNLLVISFDRYFSITRPLTYRAKRTTKRAGLMIGLAWLVSLILWAPAILFWQYFVGERTVPPDKCYIQFLSEPIITFCTAMAAFYLPVTIMSVLYWRIYKETENRSRELAGLQASGGWLGGADRPRPRFRIAATRASSKNGRSLDLSQSAQRKKSLLGLSGHFWKWRAGAAPGIHSGTEAEQTSCDTWNNNDTADHSASSEEEENAPPTARAIFSIVLSLPGMRAAVNSQIKSSGELGNSEEDPLRGTADSNNKNDGLSCSVSNGKKRFATNAADVQSTSAVQATATSVDTTDATTNKPAPIPISFKEAALAKRFVSRARTQITKRKRMSLVKEKKAAQTLSAILFAFIITWTPYNIMVLINTFCNGCIPESLWALGYWLCYVNSTVNPMCYALCNKTFRGTFKMILLCRWNEKKIKQSFQQKESVRLHRSIHGDST
ncbi:muscarinic acetylcholine receptor M3 [Clarias gariepinus]